MTKKLKSLADLGKALNIGSTVAKEATSSTPRFISRGRLYDEQIRQSHGLTEFLRNSPERFRAAGLNQQVQDEYIRAIEDLLSPDHLEFVPASRPYPVGGAKNVVVVPDDKGKAGQQIREAVFSASTPGMPAFKAAETRTGATSYPSWRVTMRDYLLMDKAERAPGKQKLDVAKNFEGIRNQALQQARSRGYSSGVSLGMKDYSKDFTKKGWDSLVKYMLSAGGVGAGTSWMLTDPLQQDETSLYKKGGNIHIKDKNRGKFTASAKAHNKGVQEYAHEVVNDPNASSTQKKRAQFAINAKKWNH